MTAYTYTELSPKDFNAIITLGNKVHGAGYLDQEKIKTYYQQGLFNGINCSFVVYKEHTLVGFRLTFSANQWTIDKWCSPEAWQVPSDKVCYFKCNTVDPNHQAQGIGGNLLKYSIDAARKQGALAGVSHLWRQSPGNAAVKYFTKCGGRLVKDHPDKWYQDSLDGYECVLCPAKACHCVAAEMIIDF